MEPFTLETAVFHPRVIIFGCLLKRLTVLEMLDTKRYVCFLSEPQNFTTWSVLVWMLPVMSACKFQDTQTVMMSCYLHLTCQSILFDSSYVALGIVIKHGWLGNPSFSSTSFPPALPLFSGGIFQISPHDECGISQLAVFDDDYSWKRLEGFFRLSLHDPMTSCQGLVAAVQRSHLLPATS